MFANTLAWKVIWMYGGASCVLCSWEIEEIPKAWVWHHRAGPLSIVHYKLVHILLPLPTHSLSPIDNNPHSLIDTFIGTPSPMTTLIYDVVLFCPFLMCCVQELRTKHVLSQARVPARPPKPPRDVNAYYCYAPRGNSVLSFIFLKLASVRTSHMTLHYFSWSLFFKKGNTPLP